MSLEISVIIPVAGKDPLRDRNFFECLTSLNSQTFREFEIIVVEQSLDGNYYKEWVSNKSIKWVCIKDPNNRGFNLSWCRNVGAKLAQGKKLVLMDADMVFEPRYLEKVMEVKAPFAGGASTYHWISSEEITGKFLSSRNFQFVYDASKADDIARIFRFTPFTRGCGYGAVLIFDKDWYFSEFGGYIEDFFKYGWEDKAAVEIIRELLKYEDDSKFEKVDYNIIHLSHFSKDMRNMKTNQDLFNKIASSNKEELIRRIKNIGVGFLDSPSLLNITI